MLLSLFSLQYLYGQTPLSLIKEKYGELDSIQYLNDLNEAVFQSVIRDFGEPLEDHIKERTNSIRNGISGQTIKFVLNVEIDTAKLYTDSCLIIKDFRFNFNIYCYDSKLNPTYYVFFVDNQLDIYGTIYPTYSKRYAKQVKFAIRQIIGKDPQYILECAHLPNTILYVKDDNIFVYSVLQKEIYQLNDYVAKFKDSKYFYVRQ